MCHDSPTLPGQVSTCCCTCRILLAGPRCGSSKVAEAEKGGRTAEANSSPGRYFARLSPTHACTAERRSGGATVCQDCHVSACSESDRLWPACQRLPDRDHHQRWRVVGLPHRSQGVCRVEKRTPPGKLPVNLLLLLSLARSPFSFPTVLRAACRQSTQASSSGGNSSMPALPLAWNLANRSPNVDPSHTRSRRGPSPAAGSHLPSSLIASHRVQACRRARGAPSHRSKRFLFSLGHPAPPPAGLFRGIRCKQPGSSRQS